MISIGNDIVDLNYTDKARINEPKFYTKFVTPSELSLRDQGNFIRIPLGHYIWMLWSVKEAAYKFLKRHQPELIFSPVRITIEHLAMVDDYYKGEVVYNSQQLYFIAVINHEVIASIVNDSPDFRNIQWSVQKVESNNQACQSLKVREFLLKELALLYPEQVMMIGKNPDSGYPVVTKNGIDTGILVSFAHHGTYVTYCFKLQP